MDDREMQRMSKYARKVAQRQKERSAEQEALAAIGIAMRITRGEAKPPAAKAAKPKTPPPPPRGLIHPLGDRPARLSRLAGEAKTLLASCETLLGEIYEMAGAGIQRAEPLALRLAVAAMVEKCAGVEYRAARIPNSKEAEA